MADITEFDAQAVAEGLVRSYEYHEAYRELLKGPWKEVAIAAKSSDMLERMLDGEAFRYLHFVEQKMENSNLLKVRAPSSLSKAKPLQSCAMICRL